MVDFFYNLAIFFVVLSILVFVHEWGHFIFARIFGVRVEEFGIGIPPKAKTIFKKGDTEYTLNWIPLGGFVRMTGQDDFDAKAAETVSNDPKSFENKGVFARICIVIGGVLMNFIFAIVLLTIVFMNGGNPISMDNPLAAGKLTVSDMIKDSIALQNGVQKGDILYSINNQVVKGPYSLRTFHKDIAGKTTKFTFIRNGQEVALNIKTDDTGKIGVMLQSPPIYLSFMDSIVLAVQETYNLSYMTVEGVGRLVGSLFVEHKLTDEVGGPVRIFEMTSMASNAGFIHLLNFMAILSISLAVMNILPFPALDGGRLVFILVEGVMRKRIINANIEGYIHMIGFALLIFLIVAITWKDILSLF